MVKYTKELLKVIVDESKSVSEVMRKLNLKITGGNHGYLSNRIKIFGIDTSHFLGQAAHCGQRSNGNKKQCDEILAINLAQKRRPSYQLRRALIECGIEEKCTICGLDSMWKNKPLRLQIDHINGDILDDRKENLRFMCPNCHSQTDTWCVKNMAR